MANEKDVKFLTHTLKVYTPGYMQQGRPRKTKDSTTPLCYVAGTDGKPLGHTWQNTASVSVRVCSRCKLVQFHKNGRWHNARNIKDARGNLGEKAMQQADLWIQAESED